MTALRILFAALFVYAACRACGQLLFSAVGLSFRRGELAFLEFLTGAALFSTLVCCLAATHLVYTSVLVTAGALPILAAYRFRRKQPAPPSDAPLTLAWKLLFGIPYLVFGLLYLIIAMAPETSPDGAGYHLGLISRYYDHRGFYHISTNMYAGLAEGIEMLFLVAFALGRHSAAALVHLLFLLTLPFGMRAWAERNAAPRAGILGALLFFLAPLAGKDGTIAYIDVATAAVVFGAFSLLEIWRTERGDSVLLPAGLLAGFALACKITAGPVPVAAVLYVLVVSRSVRLAGRTAFFAFLAAAPWLIKDAIQFQNPFFPLFNHWFPNPYQYPMVESELRRLMQHVSDVPWWQIPWQAVVGGKLFGVLGPVFLLAPLALLALRTAPGRMLLLAFFVAVLPFATNTNARFLLPALPCLALALAFGIVGIPRVGPALGGAVLLLHAGLSWPDFIDRWSPGYQWRIDRPPVATALRVAFRVVPEKTFLNDQWREYAPGLLLDRFVPPGEKVFSPDMGQMAYQHRDLLGTFDSALGRRAFLLFIMGQAKELAGTWHREIHFPPVTASRLRVATRNAVDNDLRISELRFALGQTEVVREPSWRLSASANPWEVPYAFDNNPVSWWTSGQTVSPGLFLQVDFGHPVTLDRVLLSQSVDQRWTSLRPVALLNGVWTPLRSRENDYEEPPRPSIRMEVADEFKHLGIRWILIPDGSYGANDLLEKAPYWGITRIAEANGYRLWRIN